jgi:hypothetical protein
MLERAVDHLLHNVLPAAVDYIAAEDMLSLAYKPSVPPADWETEARLAKRRAAELAIAIDGLLDRCKKDLGLTVVHIRAAVASLCIFPGATSLRQGSLERVRGVANAYKHEKLSDPTLPIMSDADILVVGLGYGLDGVGVGKFGGVEVLVREKSGLSWKFLGDAPTTIAAWFRFLGVRGAVLPAGPYHFGGLVIG